MAGTGKSIYFQEDEETNAIMERVEILQKNLRRSFSEIVRDALKQYVSVRTDDRRKKK